MKIGGIYRKINNFKGIYAGFPRLRRGLQSVSTAKSRRTRNSCAFARKSGAIDVRGSCISTRGTSRTRESSENNGFSTVFRVLAPFSAKCSRLERKSCAFQRNSRISSGFSALFAAKSAVSRIDARKVGKTAPVSLSFLRFPRVFRGIP